MGATKYVKKQLEQKKKANPEAYKSSAKKPQWTDSKNGKKK